MKTFKELNIGDFIYILPPNKISDFRSYIIDEIKCKYGRIDFTYHAYNNEKKKYSFAVVGYQVELEMYREKDSGFIAFSNKEAATTYFMHLDMDVEDIILKLQGGYYENEGEKSLQY